MSLVICRIRLRFHPEGVNTGSKMGERVVVEHGGEGGGRERGVDQPWLSDVFRRRAHDPPCLL